MKNELLESYKGVRDFYPEDQFVLDYIKDTMARACESFGFEHYNASILENAELYYNKTSEEIVNEQTYIFEDRGGRKVILRPEMTPTVTRMVARRRRELGFPLRLYSIPNVFRYERPQKGRLREHWQLNADIFGAEGIEYEIELLLLVRQIMESFGAKESDYIIKINSRSVLDKIFDKLDIPPLARKSTLALLDRKDKMPKEDFEQELLAILANETESFKQSLKEEAENGELQAYVKKLKSLGLQNLVVDTSIVRGFDYYTGFVFEVYDTDKSNPRAMFGGGRYDKLMDALGEEPLSALGFGMGDVTMRDFLELHGLLPEYRPATEIMVAVLDDNEELKNKAFDLASKLRKEDVNTAINFSFKKIDKQIKTASKLKIPFVLVLGEEEFKSNKYKLKNIQSKEQVELDEKEIANYIFESEI